MKNKLLVSVLFALILCVLLVMPVHAAPDSVVGVPEYFADWAGEEYFFANGAEITVEARTDAQEGALVKWTENGIEKSQELGTVSNIFGGMHNNETAVTTSITINGGYVNWIHGGGLHKSNTTTSNIVMNGGQVGQIKGGAADSWINGCGCTGTDRNYQDSTDSNLPAGDYKDAPAQAGTTNITIKGGKIEKLSGSEGTVYGGGNGHANTDRANVTIAGGDLSNAVVTGGGSHGNTTEAVVTITGGTIKTVQGVNRGTIINSGIVVTGGTIEKLYIGGDEAPDAKATGTITGEVAVGVVGDAKVKTLSLGLNAGQSMGESTVYKSDYILVQNGTVENAEDLGDKVATLYNVKIDEELCLVQKGYTIKDLENYNDIITRKGYTFKGFEIAENAYWNPETPVTEDIHLTTVFEKTETPEVEDNTGDNIEDNTGDSTQDSATEDVKDNEAKDESPKMGVESTMLTVFAVIAVISLAGIVLIKKANKR